MYVNGVESATALVVIRSREAQVVGNYCFYWEFSGGCVTPIGTSKCKVAVDVAAGRRIGVSGYAVRLQSIRMYLHIRFKACASF